MNIIKSYKEPDKHTIWFNTNDNNFYYFNNGKWRLMNDSEEEITEDEIRFLFDLDDNYSLEQGIGDFDIL